MSMLFGRKSPRKIYNQINTSYCTNKSLYCVEIDNLSLDKYCFDKLNDTIKFFLEDGDVFFGFYRTDGLYLTTDEFKKYSIDIPRYFAENGEYREIAEEISTRKKKKLYRGFLTVARTVSDKKLFDELQWIFKYYLETTFFLRRLVSTNLLIYIAIICINPLIHIF